VAANIPVGFTLDDLAKMFLDFHSSASSPLPPAPSPAEKRNPLPVHESREGTNNGDI
jgi:hypothetical protein